MNAAAVVLCVMAAAPPGAPSPAPLAELQPQPASMVAPASDATPAAAAQPGPVGPGAGAAAPAQDGDASSSQLADPADALTDVRLVFASKAWRLEQDQALPMVSMPASLSVVHRVTTHDGQDVADDLLLNAAPDDASRELIRKDRVAWLRPATAAMSLAATLVPIALMAPGALVGAVAGALVGLNVRAGSTGGPDAPATVVPVLLATAAGLVVGAGTGAVVLFPAAFLVTAVAAPLFFPRHAASAYAATVQAHNLALAQELALDPTTLDRTFFPLAQ